ncbi:L-fuconolactonase [Arthrobacter sp. PvP102]|uniref:amidohydrolase family protein n=1 Tax=unclassified Arthrobacter TaxID=235627 RepID=UPI001AE3B698|nr:MULTISPECIES: amidohydrolase family protein [unclassified Arthrobacter]MBP1232996.1 L-fuconolactonase [Arthrobacter sp. PvP103]MBP1238131.1 L-fuconolactonase [Arthrobacter sp. PvP102]
MKVIDSHVHVWDPTLFDYTWLANSAALNKPFLPQDLPHTSNNTRGAVFVQADCREDQALKEVDWVSALAADWPALSAVVAFARLDGGNELARDLEQLAQRPLVRGVRHLFQDLDDSQILAPQMIAGARQVALAGLTFDACVRSWQLGTLADWAREVPELSIVLDHMGKPPVAKGTLGAWRDSMRKLAGLPNVVIKLSGAGAEAAPGRPLGGQALPFIQEALQIFGPERCMIGSDWPVSMTDPAAYQGWIDLVMDSALAGASAAERDGVAWATAARFYRLDTPA